MFAVLNSNEKAVSRLLQRKDTNFEQKNYNDITPLIYSLNMKVNKRISKLLIEKSSKKNINFSTCSKLTSLHYAVNNNSTSILQALINKGAKISL